MARIELHYDSWLVGSKIEDTYDALRKDWFGNFDGLHINSYKKIKYVAGYKVSLNNIENKNSKKNKLVHGKHANKNLWFVNIGSYDPSSMQEKHAFGLFGASFELEAKNLPKSK